MIIEANSCRYRHKVQESNYIIVEKENEEDTGGDSASQGVGLFRRKGKNLGYWF